VDIIDFPHSGNPLHNGTLHLVSTTGDPEEPSFVLDRTTEIVNSTAFPLDRRFYFRLTEDDFLPEFKTKTIQGITENWANRSPWWL
jgi:hypothetical protein